MHEPAFPRDHRHDGHNGMTLRDYFAAHAMAALVGGHPKGSDCGFSGLAIQAYGAADAMLKEREVKRHA